MVRFKARWMLVRLVFADDSSQLEDPRTGRPKWFPSRQDTLHAVRTSLQDSFGTSANDAVLELQVRFCDSNSGGVLLRVSRENYPRVRASVTLLTSIQVSPVATDSTATKRTTTPQQPRVRVVASVVSVHGSLRTAKVATMRYLRHHWKTEWQSWKRKGLTIPKEWERWSCRQLEISLDEIRGMD